jgi:hypothetical protein
LLLDFSGGLDRWFIRPSENLSHKVASAVQSEFLCHDAQSAVRGDKIYRLHALVSFDRA